MKIRVNEIPVGSCFMGKNGQGDRGPRNFDACLCGAEDGLGISRHYTAGNRNGGMVPALCAARHQDLQRLQIGLFQGSTPEYFMFL